MHGICIQKHETHEELLRAAQFGKRPLNNNHTLGKGKVGRIPSDELSRSPFSLSKWRYFQGFLQGETFGYFTLPPPLQGVYREVKESEVALALKLSEGSFFVSKGLLQVFPLLES